MAIPKYKELFKTVLESLADGQERNGHIIVKSCIKSLNLSEEEQRQTIPSGQPVIVNRLTWARTYLFKAGLIERPARATYRITDAGRIALEQETIDVNYLKNFDSFKQFKCPENNATCICEVQEEESVSSDTPQERIDEAINELNKALADELMVEVMKINCYDFEKLVIKLLIAMGYGSALDNKNAVTVKSGDEGIDGILTSDKLGFDAIYIQAKQWKIDSKVSRPDIQQFVGAMAGKNATKGLFITTADFTNEAVEYTKKNLPGKVILINGDKLAKLMIEFNVGVSTVRTYQIKKLDTDFFADFE